MWSAKSTACYYSSKPSSYRHTHCDNHMLLGLTDVLLCAAAAAVFLLTGLPLTLTDCLSSSVPKIIGHCSPSSHYALWSIIRNSGSTIGLFILSPLQLLRFCQLCFFTRQRYGAY